MEPLQPLLAQQVQPLVQTMVMQQVAHVTITKHVQQVVTQHQPQQPVLMLLVTQMVLLLQAHVTGTNLAQVLEEV